MKSLLVFLAIILATIVGNAKTEDFGFLTAQKMFYNLEKGVFTVYGNSLRDIRFSVGDGGSAWVSDYKIVDEDLLIVVGEAGKTLNVYCESYSLKTFKRNFRIKCESGKKINLSLDSRFFVLGGIRSGELGSCFENQPTLTVFSTKDGKKALAINSVCGAFAFGANHKLYSFRLDEKSRKLSLLEIDVLNGQESILFSDFNNSKSFDPEVEGIENPSVSKDGQLVSFNIKGGAYPGFVIFDVTNKKRTLVGGKGKFISNLGFYAASSGYVNYNSLYDDSVNLVDWNLIFSVGCTASDYCPFLFESMNNDVFYSRAAHKANTLVIAKYKPQVKTVRRAFVYAEIEKTSAHNASKSDGKGSLYYIWSGKLMVLDTMEMKTKVFLEQISTQRSSVHTSEDQSVIMLWDRQETRFRFYDANSSALISETSDLEGKIDCGDSYWLSAMTVQVSPENRKAIIKCGSGNSIGVVNF